MSKWDVEYTDTFGGEANYSWVRRATVAVDTGERPYMSKAERRLLQKAFKRAMGITGLRGRWQDHSDIMEFRPYRMCTVLFAHWHDCDDVPCRHGEEAQD